MSLFNGLCAFPITPADEGGRVDTDALAGLLGRLDVAKVDSIGLLGSTGTYAYLDRTERRRAIKTAAEYLGGRIPLVVGIGALRTDDAQDLARDAEAAGADGLLLAPVSYTPLTDAAATLEALRSKLPIDFAIGYSGDWHVPDAILAGAAAWYSVIGGLLPHPTLALMRAAQAGDVAQVRQVGESFAPF